MESDMGKLNTPTGGSTKAKEYAAARRVGRRERAAGLRARTAFFDARRRCVVVDLINGYSIGVPLSQFPEIRNASDSLLREAEVVGAGTILHWESLDADYSVPAIILRAVGTNDIARELGRIGGQATSRAKADAARQNGAMGGRPRRRSRKPHRGTGSTKA
jgi:hypothetical protein